MGSGHVVLPTIVPVHLPGAAELALTRGGGHAEDSHRSHYCEAARGLSVSPVSRGRKPPKSGRSGKPVRRSPAFGAVPGTSRPREPTFLAGRDEVIKSLAKLVDAEVAASAYEAEALGSVVLGFLIAGRIKELWTADESDPAGVVHDGADAVPVRPF